ncbi:hypothetical protein B6R96_36350 (plasmid) [Streptomyces sp. Sge12]|uniref:hypothetical protein n=1 Tax=Streptomyces sp. Sge12 TaxID=1972846 RepID=UPI0009C265D6|nr:hypothetical protein [Streptomyces sp. Sge12]ARE79489.1 hypothetical protein B6R96_36350 [Streptomyces sp. Sge12]
MTETIAGDAVHEDRTLFRPWGLVDPAFWAGPETEEAPTPATVPLVADTAAEAVCAEVAEELAAIQTVAAVDLARAGAIAEELDAKTTTARGERHIETVRVREVRAYLVLLSGHHEAAVAWYLHVVLLHAALHGPDHDETTLAVRRAYSMWKALPPSKAEPLADGLIETFTKVQGAGTDAVRRIQIQLAQRHTSSAQPAQVVSTP